MDKLIATLCVVLTGLMIAVTAAYAGNPSGSIKQFKSACLAAGGVYTTFSQTCLRDGQCFSLNGQTVPLRYCTDLKRKP